MINKCLSVDEKMEKRLFVKIQTSSSQEKDKVAPKTTTMKMKRKNTKYTFPKYSYTVITLKK